MNYFSSTLSLNHVYVPHPNVDSRLLNIVPDVEMTSSCRWRVTCCSARHLKLLWGKSAVFRRSVLSSGTAPSPEARPRSLKRTSWNTRARSCECTFTRPCLLIMKHGGKYEEILKWPTVNLSVLRCRKWDQYLPTCWSRPLIHTNISFEPVWY